jgi:radical SAM superfamily enzyme YgiQ (UPF0313 family)
MRIVFVHRMVYQDPLGILYLAARLRQAGHDPHFVDVALDRRWAHRVAELAPDVVGYSVTTGNHDFFLKINRRLKRRLDFLSLWGGPHPTFFPEFINEEGVDLLCVGEGEEAMVELADALDAGHPLTNIANLHVKQGGRSVRNEVRPLVANLDDLPFPDRSLVDHYAQYRFASSRAVITSRGCPYRCNFCFNSRFRQLYRGRGRYTRRHSVDYVIEQCRRHRDDPWVERILFKDDLFAQDEAYIRQFAERYGKEVGLPFACNVRADRLTEGIVDDLARAGAAVVHFGVEAGSERVRREILGRSISDEALRRTARWCHDRGIRVYTYNLLGVPGESRAEAYRTLSLNAELRPDLAVFTLFQPYPRTPLGDRAVELGWTEKGYGGFSASYYRNSMAGLPHRRHLSKMVNLFPLAVAYPRLQPLVPTLLALPLKPLYWSVDFVHKATRFVFTLGLVSPRDIALFSGHWRPKAAG